MALNNLKTSLSDISYCLLTKMAVVTSLPILLTGCIGDTCDNCSAPELALTEMQMHGVAITTRTFPFPDTVDTEFVSDAQYSSESPIEYLHSYEILLAFSPIEDQAISAHPDQNEWDEHPYAYSFSEFVNGDYNTIKPLLPFNYSVAPTTDLTSEYAPTRVDNFPGELVLYGNHFLMGEAAFPVSATHVELWFRQQREDDLTLVRRVALENFHAWREYFKPVLQNSQ